MKIIVSARKARALMALALNIVFWYYLARAAARLFARYTVKATSEGLKTPLVYLKHKETGREILLIGMLHRAERGYFEQVQGIIALHESEGSTVFAEGIGLGKAKDRAELTPQEQTALAVVDAVIASQPTLIDVLGLEHQLQRLRPNHNWIFADLDRIWIARLLIAYGNIPLPKQTKCTCITSRIFRGIPALARWTAQYRLLVSPARDWWESLVSFKAHHRKRDAYIAHWRHEVLMDSLSRCSGNAVIVWGADHIRDIKERLHREGFRLQCVSWLTAYEKRNYPFPLRALRDSMNLAARAASQA